MPGLLETAVQKFHEHGAAASARAAARLQATDITPADLRCGAGAVTAKLRIHGVDPDSILQFRDDCGPLPRGSKTTLLGYALLSGDAALLDALLSHGADPNKRVGLPHTFNLTPLQLAVALGLEAPVRRLLAAPSTNPNAPLQLKTRGATRPMHKPQPTSQPTAARRPQPGVLVPSDFTYTREGDSALHMAIDCHQDTAPGLLQALLDDPRTDVHVLNAQTRSPLFKACKRRSHAAAASLLQLPRCDVNAGGPVFGAIAAESPALVQVLVNAGAEVSSSVVNERGQTPLRCALERESVLFVDRAQAVRLLTAAGAGVAPDMLAAARRRGWKEVLQALLEAPCQEAGAGALAVSGSFGRMGSGRGGGGGEGGGGGSGAGGSPRTPRTPRGGLAFAAASARFGSRGGSADSEGEAGPKSPRRLAEPRGPGIPAARVTEANAAEGDGARSGRGGCGGDEEEHLKSRGLGPSDEEAAGALAAAVHAAADRLAGFPCGCPITALESDLVSRGLLAGCPVCRRA